MKCRKVVGALILGIIAAVPSFITPTSASPDAPLSVYVSEWVNATIETDGLNVNCGAWNVTGNVTIYNSAGERVFDIWLPIYLEQTYTYLTPLSVVEQPSYAKVVIYNPGASLPSWITNTYPTSGYGDPIAMYWVHVTELDSGDRIVLTYAINGSSISVCPPLRVTETIDPEKIVDGQAQDIEVNITVINDMSVPVDVKLRKILPADNGVEGWANATGNPAFTSAGSATAGSSGLSGDAKQLIWTSDGSWPDGWFQIAADSNANLTGVTIHGTPDLDEVGGSTQKVELGRIHLRFKLDNAAFSGAYVGYLYASSDVDFEAKKEQDTTTPTTWYETLVIYDTSGVFDYEIVYTKLWATTTNNPGDKPIDGSENSQTGSPIAVIGPGEDRTSYQYGPFSFSSGVVPKVWEEYRFRIQRDETYGWMNYTNTTVGADSDGKSRYVVKEMIWVVKGYLVKARKEVRPGPNDNMTCITIEVYNAGQWMTPYVEFYDLIPLNFAEVLGSSANESMMFFPIEMLAQDADPASPDDYSLVITGLSGYSKGYVWKTYPIPAPQMGFAEWFDNTTAQAEKSVEVTFSDGTSSSWLVYPSSNSAVHINFRNGTIRTFNEGDAFKVNGTTYKVVWIQDSLSASSGGKVAVSAKGVYENLDMDVYNPVVAHYCVVGQGEYSIPDIFIVGVDPRNTLDASAVLMPSASLEIGAVTYEQWMIIAVAALVIVGVLSERRRKAPTH